MTIGKAFNKTVEYYDDWVKQALPNYTELFAAAVSLLPKDQGKGMTVLDLGAGTGLFSSHVYDKLPAAKFVLWDVAEQMLDVAKERFLVQQAQFEFVVKDYREITGLSEVNVVISSLSIHHLLDPDKQELFRNIYSILKTGGLFINIDQFAAESEDMVEQQWSQWLNYVRTKQLDEKRIQQSIKRRKEYDHDATLTQQLEWIKQAGFKNADCAYKNYFVGVFSAEK
jgi:tRNA (cmo5U34)-methyltransferase